MIRREIVLASPPAEVWRALTEPSRLTDWFANTVELELRPGGRARFGWDNGESREAVVTEVTVGERLAFAWSDEGEVEFTLTETAAGTQLTVIETTPSWTTALDLQASALARV